VSHCDRNIGRIIALIRIEMLNFGSEEQTTGRKSLLSSNERNVIVIF
jgi:hypothetical protein